MYQVFGTIVTASILYLISYFLHKSGFYSQTVHRKIWNSILALSFILTAIAGIFLALQVNYKWDIPGIKVFLRWHVEIGILLATVGIFHFLWHLAYFRKVPDMSGKTEFQRNEIPGSNTSALPVNLFVAGFTSTAVQLILIRELMNITGGYELNTGIFLASWLIASAAGAAMSSRSEINDIGKLNLVFSISPLISLILLILFTRLFLEPGESPSLLITILLTLLVLIPFCFVSGFLFIRLANISRIVRGSLPGRSYSIETIGGISGGFLITLLGNGILNNYQVFLLAILLSLVFTFTTYYIYKRRSLFIFRIIAALFASVIILTKPDVIFRQALLPVIKVKETTDTPYGNITRGEYHNERSVYYDHRLLTYNADLAESEENIHYGMVQVKKPENVILISGNVNSLIPELEKYDLHKIICIERDPALISFENDRRLNEAPDIEYVNSDAYSYIRKNPEKTDAVIMLLPPPSTLSLNRYYTTEFFSEVNRKLNQGGVFVCSPGNEVNYLNQETLDLYSSVYTSLKKVFSYVKPIPGNRLYLIASSDSISAAICSLLEKRNIENTYVGPDFLADDLLVKRSQDLEEALAGKGKENTVLLPVACFHYQVFNLSKSLDEKIPAIILFFLLFAIPLFAVRRKNLVMYFSASSLAGFEIICLMLVQTIAGNMYLFTGFIISGLMTGLAIGSGIQFRAKRPLLISTILLIVFYLLTAFTLNIIIKAENNFYTLTGLLLIVMIPSILTGIIFSEMTKRDNDGTVTSGVYASDLAGSAFGFILASGFMLPVLGLKMSVIILSAFIFGGLLFGTEWNK